MAGYDPLSDSVRALMDGSVRLASDMTGFGLDGRVAYWADIFQRSPEHRLVMRLARDAHIPYSEAQHRWRDAEDLAAEIAFNALEAAEHEARCPKCGVTPDDMYGEDGRELKEPRWKFATHNCRVCKTIASLQEDLGENGEIRLMHRDLGDEHFER